MSAYMVDRAHIRYLVDAAMSRRIARGQSSFYWHWNGEAQHLHAGDYQRAAAVGQMLWDENRKSIESRYPDTRENFENAPGPCGESFVYDDHDPLPLGTVDPVQVLKSCHCYAYQACEHDGWEESNAKAFLTALEKHAVTALVGYEDAEWGAPKTYEQKAAAYKAKTK